MLMTNSLYAPAPKRVDLHCHSDASNEASEAMLNAIGCPESYSRPREVYAQAKRRGMDFVTITDHDSIDGMAQLGVKPDVLVGEELSCWFPEDDCKMHVLVWGVTAADHVALQSAARDIYRVAEYIEQHRIAHAVAHPLYRQNDRLERWHLERLILLFKGFECLNGAHSMLHREALDPLLNELTRQQIQVLADKHRIVPRWPEPWFKARVGGSDDHGLLNVGRTWTEFPHDVRSVDEVLECLRQGVCQPGGDSGSGLKLAHNMFGVAVRYFSRQMLPAGRSPTLPTLLLQAFVGERPAPSKRQLVGLVLKKKLASLAGVVRRPWGSRQTSGGAAGILAASFLDSAKARLAQHPDLLAAIREGDAPLGRHDSMFRFAAGINRDTAVAIADAAEAAIKDARLTGVFDSISAVLAQQFLLVPYYFSFFHQNQERHLLSRITGHGVVTDPNKIKVGLFTDTLDEVNGVGRFIRDMSEQAARKGRTLVVHTCSKEVRYDFPWRKNFTPIFSRHLPYYPELQLNLPPLLEIMEWADRQQFDAIEISTPGAMGLCGLIVAKMLRIPVLGTYHTDFPAFVQNITGDNRLALLTTFYMRLLYGRFDKVFSRTRQYFEPLRQLGVREDRLVATTPGVDTDKFNVSYRDINYWAGQNIGEPYRLLFCGRISLEKNLPVLVEAFKELCKIRRDAALIIAGDGPYLKKMKEELAGLPAYFYGYLGDKELARLYASCDMYLFPSRTDTLGQVILEAQACGLPVLVSDEGGPKEVMDDGVTGLVLKGTEPALWCTAINDLLNDEPRRLRMSRTAVTRVSRYSLDKAFDTFWAEFAKLVCHDYRPEPVVSESTVLQGQKVS